MGGRAYGQLVAHDGITSMLGAWWPAGAALAYMLCLLQLAGLQRFQGMTAPPVKCTHCAGPWSSAMGAEPPGLRGGSVPHGAAGGSSRRGMRCMQAPPLQPAPV
jgi:hypothetical protein